MRGILLGAALSMAASAALAQPAPQCADHVPQARPQNTFFQHVGRSLDRIVEEGWIEIAVYDDLPPWSSVVDGQPVGIDVDLARLIGSELGVETRIRPVQAGETLEQDLLNYVWQGAAVGGHVSNLLLHAPYDPDFACRVDQVMFTGIYAEESLAIAYRPADYPDKGPVPAYFRYDPVAVENDSLSDFYLTSLIGATGSTVQRHRSTAEAMAALAAGDVMAVMAPVTELEGLRPDGVVVHSPPLIGLERDRWTLGVALSTQHRPLGYEVDAIIGRAVEDGRLAEIFARHGANYRPGLR